MLVKRDDTRGVIEECTSAVVGREIARSEMGDGW